MNSVFLYLGIISGILFFTGSISIQASSLPEMIIIGDTQYYTNKTAPTVFDTITDWIKDNVSEENIVFVTHVGDVTNDATIDQWQSANNSVLNIDGNGPNGLVPYSINWGNHDFLLDTANGLAYFGASRYAPYSVSNGGWYGGNSSDELNTYQYFLVNGVSFLHINLRYNPGSSDLTWAQGIIDANPNKPTIITTHDFLGDNVPNRSTVGNTVWNSLVDGNSQVFMVISGHNWPSRHETGTTTDGRKIIQAQFDPQNEYKGGTGFIQKVIFDTENSQIRFQTYSPYIDATLTDWQNSFIYSASFTANAVIVGDEVFSSTQRTFSATSATNWQDSANWGGTAPCEGDFLIFPRSTTVSVTNDFSAGTSFSGIFLGTGRSSFTVGGNSLKLTGDFADGSYGSGTITFNTPIELSGNIQFFGDRTMVMSEIISGSGSFTKMGAGGITFSAVNNYTGTTTLLGGNLTISGNGKIGNESVAIINNKKIIYNGVSTTWSGNITGIGILDKQGSNTLTLSGSNTFSGGTTFTAGTLSVASHANLGNGTLTISGVSTLNITGTSATFENTVALGNISGNWTISSPGSSESDSLTTFNGVISGGGTSAVLFFQGGGLKLNGINTFLGSIDIESGSLILGNASAAGLATIKLNSSQTSNGDLQLVGSFTVANDVNLLKNATIGNASSSEAVLSGIISGTGYGITKVGAGSLSLSGVNAYTGDTVINVGTLNISGSVTSSVFTINIDSSPSVSNSGYLILSSSPDLSGKIINISVSEPYGTFSWTAVSWDGTATGTPVLKLNNAIITSGEQTIVSNYYVSVSYSSSSGINVVSSRISNNTSSYSVRKLVAIKNNQLNNELLSPKEVPIAKENNIIANSNKSFVFTKILKLGSKNNEVRELQKALILQGFSLGKIDGYFGSLTRRALMKFQKAKGLKADGILGPKTIKMIK